MVIKSGQKHHIGIPDQLSLAEESKKDCHRREAIPPGQHCLPCWDYHKGGHYVADVYRFDAGIWFRYDDTIVTETDINSVRLSFSFINTLVYSVLFS